MLYANDNVVIFVFFFILTWYCINMQNIVKQTSYICFSYNVLHLSSEWRRLSVKDWLLFLSLITTVTNVLQIWKDSPLRIVCHYYSLNTDSNLSVHPCNILWWRKKSYYISIIYRRSLVCISIILIHSFLLLVLKTSFSSLLKQINTELLEYVIFERQ